MIPKKKNISPDFFFFCDSSKDQFSIDMCINQLGKVGNFWTIEVSRSVTESKKEKRLGTNDSTLLEA